VGKQKVAAPVGPIVAGMIKTGPRGNVQFFYQALDLKQLLFGLFLRPRGKEIFCSGLKVWRIEAPCTRCKESSRPGKDLLFEVRSLTHAASLPVPIRTCLRLPVS